MQQEINKTIYAVRNIRHYRGDDFLPIIITFKVNNTPIDLTGSNFLMKVINKGDASKTSLLTFAEGTGITSDLINGQITLFKTAAQIDSLAAGEYVYDLQETNTYRQTWLRGLFIVEDDTTIP